MSDDLFPLDILYSDVSSWLTSRRKLNSDWLTQLRTIQCRVDIAFKELPLAFTSRFTRTDDGLLEYLTARNIRDELTESSERGYFGGLSGTAGVWDKLIKQYERNNVYLGEVAQRLAQNVDFEIPFLKKQMESLDKKALDLARVKAESENNAISADLAFSKECQELGIKGIHLESEVPEIGNRVYSLLEEGRKQILKTETKTILEFYRSMNHCLHGSGKDALEVLECVIKENVEPPSPELMERQQIDQPLIHEEALAPKEDRKEGGNSEIEINWDLPEIEHVEGDLDTEWKDGDQGDIDWNFEVEVENVHIEEESAAQIKAPDLQLKEAITHEDDVENIAKVEDISSSVLCFVWDKNFRNKLLDDLCELQSFLKIRCLADPTDAVLLSFSDVLYKVDHAQMKTYLSHIEEIIKCFAGVTAQRYLMLKTSKNYEMHLLEDLRKKSKKPQDWKKSVIRAEQEKNAIQTELSQTSIKIGQLIRHTQELKNLAEKSISSLFNNRQINIMGKINTIQQSHLKE